jgi:hypothetical protein
LISRDRFRQLEADPEHDGLPPVDT